MSALFLYCGGTNELKCLANVEFRPGPVAIISPSINASAIILFTVSSIIGLNAASADAADARVIAAAAEAPVGNAPGGGGGGGGGGRGGGGLPGCGGAGGGFDGVIAGVTKLDGGNEGAHGLGRG
jgi:hypothetical protein